MMIPNVKNFCGGAFPDWLEVNLTNKCNARCSWCIEKSGYHPKEVAGWWIIVQQAINHGALNIILLGGEPTLYRDLKPLIQSLFVSGKRVWITTNGSKINCEFIDRNLVGIYGMNISVHHYDADRNFTITGLKLDWKILTSAISMLKERGVATRLNCNCISGEIDNIKEITNYIDFAKNMGASKVRFAELKQDSVGFVDLAKTLNYKYGLNDNPFTEGCNSDTVINGMPVNFRQMCGLQTSRRIAPQNPSGVMKRVLYYDGKFYDGWQTNKKEEIMTKKELAKLLRDVESGKTTAEEAALLIGEEMSKQKEVIVRHESGGGGYCQY